MMKTNRFEISGGAAVSYKAKNRCPLYGLLILPILLLLLPAAPAFAQGSIYGSVTNSDASVPANGEISFFGFLDDTDEEIRIETSVGAGYDAGNWYDDFQNYLTEAPGNPYDYYFYNSANSEVAVLSELIPNNSFQQEDIVLIANPGWPAEPVGLAARVVSGTSLILTWDFTPGLTYHIYRRLATSTGSFFRVDDPTGALANHGIAEGYFIDDNVDGVSEYQYMIIAEDGAGNFSPHSVVFLVNSANVEAPTLATINPDNGPSVGGTTVTITGAGFDRNGLTVTIGGNPLASQSIISPYEITGTTPVGAIGPANVIVTNSASGLTSNILSGGYTFNGNTLPEFDPIADQSVTEGENLNFVVVASDVDGTTPTLTATDVPATATFVDNGDGTGTFDWTPNFTEGGPYQVTFTASDGIGSTDAVVGITVNEAGNQAPEMAPVDPQTIAENSLLSINISAIDPDEDVLSLTVTDQPTGATFTDNTDGTGLFEWTPAFDQAGDYEVIFKVFDGALVDSVIVPITVTNTNQPPVLAAIGPQTGTEAVLLSIPVSATDADGVTPILTTSTPLPGTATFVDNLDGTGLFEWTPGFTDAGPYQVTFYADDGTDIVSELVDITINEAGNQAPVLDPIGPLTTTEGVELIAAVTASDIDGDIPALTAEDLPLNATFVDNADGTGDFNFIPDFNQSGTYDVRFIASDGVLADTEMVVVTVNEVGNQPPVIAPINDTTINEGQEIELIVNANDPDGVGVQLTVSSTLPSGTYSFTDSGNGVGVFNFVSDYYDAADYSIIFFATDLATPPASSSVPVTLTIVEVNQPPVIEPVGPFGVAVDDNLTFDVTATDSTAPNPLARLYLTATGLPANASFVDNGDNTGTFDFNPDGTQIGPHSFTVIATDQGSPQLSDQLVIDITVVTENIEPVWTTLPGPAQALMEGETLQFQVAASDPDGNIPTLYIIKAPENSAFVDNGDGTGEFTFNPSYIQAGLHQVVLAAYDGIDENRTQPILIQVGESGNQAPEIDPVTLDPVVEGSSTTYTITTSDPDATIPSLSAENLPENSSFTDNGDGSGTIAIAPSYVQAGSYDVTIIATDGELSDTLIVTIVVEEAGNQTPVLDPISDQTVQEMLRLTFDISASDVDEDFPVLSVVPLPVGADFTDNGDGTGTFDWQTDNFSSGTYLVSFVATDAVDAALYDSLEITIIVTDTNLTPYPYVPFQERSVSEGDTLLYIITGTDPDGTIPIIEVNEPDYALIDNMTFYDSGNGTALLTFTPDYTQGAPSPGNLYYLQWRVVDSEDPTLSTLTLPPTQFIVYNTNRPPVVTAIDDTTITEGDTLKFNVTAVDPDGSGASVTGAQLPANSVLAGSLGFLKSFTFIPDYTQAGTYEVLFIGTDGIDEDTAVVNITVLDAGNQIPVFTTSMPSIQPIVAGAALGHTTLLTAVDPDMDPLTISCSLVPPNGVYTDSGNGVATLVINPDISVIGDTYDVRFIVTDPSLVGDTIDVTYQVVEFLRGDANSDSELNMSDIMSVSYTHLTLPTN